MLRAVRFGNKAVSLYHINLTVKIVMLPQRQQSTVFSLILYMSYIYFLHSLDSLSVFQP